jgi:hypothetical protein
LKFIRIFSFKIYLCTFKIYLNRKKKKTTCWAELARPIRRLLPGGSESLPQRAGHSSPHAPGLSSIDTRSIKGGCSAFEAKANYVSTWNARLAGYKRIRSGVCRGDFLISLHALFCPSLTRYFAFLLPPRVRRRSPARIYSPP